MERGDGRTGKRRQLWIGIAFSVACLAGIFFFVSPADILAALRQADYGYLALSTGGILVFMALRAVRWRFILDNAVSWRRVFHVQNIGYMLTMLLPFRLGDVARAVLIGRTPPITLPQGLSTMVVERVLDLLFIVTLLPFTLANSAVLPANLQTAMRLSGTLGLTALGVLIVAANQRPRAVRLARRLFGRFRFLNADAWTNRVDQVLAGLSSLTHWRSGAALVLLSIVVWLPILFAYYNGLRAVHLQPTWAMAGFVVCAAALSITAPSSPGQIGVFHAGVIFALAEVLGQPLAESTGFAFLYHALNLLLMVVLGLVGVYGTSATLGDLTSSTRALATAGSGPEGGAKSSPPDRPAHSQ